MTSYQSQLEKYVGVCDRHIVLGRAAIGRQRGTIANLPLGYQKRLAERLLVMLLHSQRLHEEHRQSLLKEIDRSEDSMGYVTLTEASHAR